MSDAISFALAAVFLPMWRFCALHSARRQPELCSLGDASVVDFLGWQGCYQGSLGDKASFRHVCSTRTLGHGSGLNGARLRMSGLYRLLVGMRARLYTTRCPASGELSRSRGIPAATLIDDTWQCTPLDCRFGTAREHWLATAAGLRLAAQRFHSVLFTS